MSRAIPSRPFSRLAFRGALVATVAVCAFACVTLSAHDARAQEASSGTAYTVPGHLGIGYHTGNAPLGVRMWFTNQLGFDAGLGFVLNGEEPDIEDTDPDATTITADFAIDVGFLIALWKGDNSILYVRPGINFDRRYAQGTNDDFEPVHSSFDTVRFDAGLGVEWFLTEFGLEQISLQAGVGIGFSFVAPPDQPGDNETDWVLGSNLRDFDIFEAAELGFHYYFM